jgi:hypothetical protein
MTNASDRIAELTAQLQHQQCTARFRFGFLLVLMAGLALTIWLRPVAQPGQPVIIGEPGGRALLTVDGDTPMLRLGAGQASVQLSAQLDGTAVLPRMSERVIGGKLAILPSGVEPQTRILLANLFQRSRSDVSTSNFPSSYEVEEAVCQERCPALWSSPTVSHVVRPSQVSQRFAGHVHGLAPRIR